MSNIQKIINTKDKVKGYILAFAGFSQISHISQDTGESSLEDGPIIQKWHTLMSFCII